MKSRLNVLVPDILTLNININVKDNVKLGVYYKGFDNFTSLLCLLAAVI